MTPPSRPRSGGINRCGGALPRRKRRGNDEEEKREKEERERENDKEDEEEGNARVHGGLIEQSQPRVGEQRSRATALLRFGLIYT